MISQLSFHCNHPVPLYCSICFFNLLTVVERNTFLKTAHIISEIIHSRTTNLPYLAAIALRIKANITANDPDHPLYLVYLKNYSPPAADMRTCAEISRGKIKEVVTIRRAHPGYPAITTNSTGMILCCILFSVLRPVILYNCYHCMMLAAGSFTAGRCLSMMFSCFLTNVLFPPQEE